MEPKIFIEERQEALTGAERMDDHGCTVRVAVDELQASQKGLLGLRLPPRKALSVPFLFVAFHRVLQPVLELFFLLWLSSGICLDCLLQLIDACEFFRR